MSKKKKIAILMSGSIHERRGFFNAVVNRTKHLMNNSNYECEVILMSEYEPWLVRKLRGTTKVTKPDRTIIDGVQFIIDWKRYLLIDYFLSVKLHKKPYLSNLYYRNFWKRLEGYDFVVAHSTEAGRIAMEAKKHLGIPFSVTWHGSDTHSDPFSNASVMSATKEIYISADVNFFVSDALKRLSEKIHDAGKKEVLYNGADERFHKYSTKQRVLLRQKLKVEGKKVVTFVGNFMKVKNILVVPDIFRAIYVYDKDVVFWMLGDGKYRRQVEEKVKDLPVILWGNRLPEEIPDFLNCTDVQILPSLNEGLPLTMVEALRSGCHAVGSMVGGIPEVIGYENCISLEDPHYVQHFADRVLFFLNEGKEYIQEAAPCFDWNQSAKKEKQIIDEILK